MRLVHTSLAVAIAAALVAGATAKAGSGEATAQRQRVAINMIVNNNTDTAIFTLSRLPGQAHPPMDVPGVRLDKGTVAMSGWAGGTLDRNGMRVFGHMRWPTLDGQNGTLELVQRYDVSEMQNGVGVGVGTWKIAKGTGAYSGIKGGGRLVAVSMLNGRTLVRQEGWVTVTG